MTTGELITVAYENILDIGGDAAQALDFRQRILLHLRRAVNAMWWYRPWPWTFAASGAITIPSGQTVGLVPTDFYALGPYTKLWKVDDPVHIFFRHPPAVRNRLRRSPDVTAQRPEMWCLLGQGNYDSPAAPTVTPVGAAGAVAYDYAVEAVFGSTALHSGSPTGSTAAGNAILDNVNFNRISWPAVTGATGYNVFRTLNGPEDAPRRIATNIALATFDDTGITGVPQIAPSRVNTTFGLKQILIAPRPDVTINFEMTDYKRRPPLLVDEVALAADTTPGLVVVGDEGQTLYELPAQYHETVLLDYLRRRLMSDEGDEREPLADTDFRLALRDAWAEENPENLEGGALPPAFYGSGSEEDG